MSMASSCAYPPTYFEDMGAVSDEELEIERNDVRDLLRVVAGSGEGGSTAAVEVSKSPAPLSVKILGKLLVSCQEAVQAACDRHEIVSETAVHAFSSLAKPLNHLAKYHSTSAEYTAGTRDILRLALLTLGLIAQAGVDTFQKSKSVEELLPSSRIANIAVASLTPMLASLAGGEDEELASIVAQVVNVSTVLAIHSIEQLPELTSPSVLDHSQYDIRGSMRGPGGEDHVGCLALMRLVSEDDKLTQCMVIAITPHIQRLCELHGKLKSLERQRGKGVFHGSGVLPQSRRVSHAGVLSSSKGYFVAVTSYSLFIDSGWGIVQHRASCRGASGGISGACGAL